MLRCYFPNSIKKEDVINLFAQISSEHPMPERFTVRNDNGSQFVASQVQDYFVENNIIQEFTKPSTPQQNDHIESYHSIMESAIYQRFEFKDLDDFNERMDRFRKFYNSDRIHGGLEITSPAKFLKKHGFDMKRKAA